MSRIDSSWPTSYDPQTFCTTCSSCQTSWEDFPIQIHYQDNVDTPADYHSENLDQVISCILLNLQCYMQQISPFLNLVAVPWHLRPSSPSHLISDQLSIVAPPALYYPQHHLHQCQLCWPVDDIFWDFFLYYSRGLLLPFASHLKDSHAVPAPFDHVRVPSFSWPLPQLQKRIIALSFPKQLSILSSVL